MANHNSPEYLEKVKNTLFYNLSQIDFAPSVQMHEPAPTHRIDYGAAVDDANPDARLPDEIADKIIDHDNEFYDGEKEGGDLRNEQNYKRAAAGSPSGDIAAKKAKSEQEGEAIDG